MGTYSDVAIAIDKETYARHALLKKVPKVLAEEPYIEHDRDLHWYLENQKWYSRFEEVQELEQFLCVLEDEGDIETGRTWTSPLDGKEHVHTVPRFGYLTMSEDGPIEERGDPLHFDIGPVSYVECPGRDAMLAKQEASQ